MFMVKHLMDPAASDDGERLFVEAGGLTKDLAAWCEVKHVLCHLGPPRELVKWFEEHPDGYEYFRGRYHEALANGPYMKALQQLACDGMRRDFTLLHTGDSPAENTATALYEFLSELEAHCPPNLDG